MTTDQSDRAGVFADLGSDGGPPSVFVSFIAKGALAPAPVVVSDTPNPQLMGMAANPEGNVMVLWREASLNYTIYSNHSAEGAGWDGNLTVVSTVNYIQNFRLVGLGGDKFLAVWAEYDTMFHLWGSVYNGAAGWGSPQELITPAEDAYGLTVASSPAAGAAAVAIWAQTGMNASLTLVRYTSPNWWGPDIIAWINGTGTNVVYPELDVDARGTTHLLWGEVPELSEVSNLTYQREDTDRVWSVPAHFQVVEADYLQISAADDGGVAISWTAVDSTRTSRPYVAREVPGSGWRATQVIDEVNSPRHSTYALFAKLAAGGNYTALWSNTDGAERLLVYRDFIAGNDPPVLSVTSPAEGATSSGPAFLVEGTTLPGATVNVDGTAAAVSPEGTFSVRIVVSNGTHAIEITAVDMWGNSAQRWVNVAYTDPAPGLQQQLTAAQAEALAAHELAHTVQQSADARADNLSNQLNASNAIVQHMQTDMDFLKASSGNTTAADARAAAAQSAAGTATMLAVLGMVIGLAGVGMAFMKGRGGGRGGARVQNPPPEPQAPSPSEKGGPEGSPPSPPPSG